MRASRVDFDAATSSSSSSDSTMGFVERALSAAGAAVVSAILVNPLDVAKTRLQAQAAGVLHNDSQYLFGRHMASIGPSMIFSDFRCSPSCARASIFGPATFCPPDCFQYKGTIDVFYKVVRQEGLARLWRGTNAGLALAVPTVGIYLPCYDIFRNWIEEFTSSNAPSLTPYAPLVSGVVSRSLACIACSPIELARTRMQAFKEFRDGSKPPGIGKTLLGVLSPVTSTNKHQSLQSYRVLWTGVGAQLSRDVPFSAICWSTLEPIRRRLMSLVGEDGNLPGVLGANFAAGFVAGSIAAAATCPLDVAKTRRQIEIRRRLMSLVGEDGNLPGVLGANFAAGFVAGSIAAAATCPLDVAKTRRQIEKNPAKALKMTTRQTLLEIWRDGRLKGLFTGVGPRVGRAGPSVGIVVSFYEVVKYILHQRLASS